MKSEQEIAGISYTLRTTRQTKRIVISIKADGAVVVSRSPRISIKEVEKAIYEKQNWIIAKRTEQLSKPKKLLAHYSVKDFKENSSRARKLVIARLEYFNKFYGHKIGKIYIRNQKSRWGSCSSRGNLNFNYKIVFLPAELADYIIVHELCHIAQMNHGKNFWNLIAKTVPQWETLRKEMQLY